MEIKEILKCFNSPDGRFPSEAVNAAIEKQEEITPHLLAILQTTISNYALIDNEYMDYIFALYLLSKFREKKALPYILALASLPGDWPEKLLGDCITEGLACFIVSTTDNDFSSIKQVIENETLNEWSRSAALKSLLGFVALKKLQREEVINYLRSLFHSKLADNEKFLTHLIIMAVDLYPEELMNEINQAFKADKVDMSYIDEGWVEEVLKNGKEQCLADYVYNDLYHLPIDDVKDAMGPMLAFCPSEEMSKTEYDYWGNNDNDFNSKIIIPYVRETPKIDQSDLCFCGSGKKFTKCCLS